MRSDLILLVVLALALVQFDHEHDGPMQLVQTGPLPTSVVNPRLGAPPPGGHLGETGRATGVVPPAGNAAPADAAARAGSRLGTVNGDRVGAPPVNAVPNAPVAAVPPPAMGAVPPPAADAVPASGR